MCQILMHLGVLMNTTAARNSFIPGYGTIAIPWGYKLSKLYSKQGLLQFKLHYNK